LRAFGIAAFFVMLAEMGDKTQLVALAFATRYKATTVLAGVLGATLLVHLFSVALGETAALLISIFWITLLSGVAFIGFGIWTLRGDALDSDDSNQGRGWGPLMTVAITFFLAELGDKTMLATITIAGEQRQFVAVWLGSSLGMVVADGLAIALARGVRSRIPEKPVRYAAAAIFVASGIFTILAAFRG
jgi:putative Ca2+/H+ antiporter (TMEM165/GDT1 family)